jgi:hypothetical protein
LRAKALFLLSDFYIETGYNFDTKINFLIKGEIMDINEIFAELKAHMLGGMVFHDEMIRYYSFLRCYDWKEEHEHHYNEKTKGYRELCDYYISHYDKLIPNKPMERPDVIPESWYKYSREDVDESTKRNALKFGLKMWMNWEKKTLELYQAMCKQLMDMGEVASAIFLTKYITAVDEELKEAQKRLD